MAHRTTLFLLSLLFCCAFISREVEAAKQSCVLTIAHLGKGDKYQFPDLEENSSIDLDDQHYLLLKDGEDRYFMVALGRLIEFRRMTERQNGKIVTKSWWFQDLGELSNANIRSTTRSLQAVLYPFGGFGMDKDYVKSTLFSSGDVYKDLELGEANFRRALPFPGAWGDPAERMTTAGAGTLKVSLIPQTPGIFSRAGSALVGVGSSLVSPFRRKPYSGYSQFGRSPSRISGKVKTITTTTVVLAGITTGIVLLVRHHNAKLARLDVVAQVDGKPTFPVKEALDLAEADTSFSHNSRNATLKTYMTNQKSHLHLLDAIKIAEKADDGFTGNTHNEILLEYYEYHKMRLRHDQLMYLVENIKDGPTQHDRAHVLLDSARSRPDFSISELKELHQAVHETFGHTQEKIQEVITERMKTK